MGAWIILALVIAAAVWAIAIYNGLVVLRNRFKNAFAQIDVQLRRRYDLIPNLVESVKGYLQHERQTLDAVVQARGSGGQRAQRAALRRRATRRQCRAWRTPKAPSAAPSAGWSRSSRATPTSRRTRAWPRCRRSSPAPRTRSHSPARPTTTR
jgi:hypothetical protein